MKENTEIARVASKAREKAEYEAAERAKAWAEAKAKEKVDISSLAAEVSKKAAAKA